MSETALQGFALSDLLPGDLLAVHTTGWLGTIIQEAQWKRHGPTIGTLMNHVAVVGRREVHVIQTDGTHLPDMAIYEADWPAVLMRPFSEWRKEWLYAPKCYALHLRIPGLPLVERVAIAHRAKEMLGRPYDVQTLLTLGWIYAWWRMCHPYAAWRTRHMRRTARAVTCSELAIRAHPPWGKAVEYPSMRSLAEHPDAVDPAMIVNCGAWEIRGEIHHEEAT